VVYHFYTADGVHNYTISGINAVSLIISKIDRLTVEGGLRFDDLGKGVGSCERWVQVGVR